VLIFSIDAQLIKLIYQLNFCNRLIFVKIIGKFWEVADFKGIVTNG